MSNCIVYALAVTVTYITGLPVLEGRPFNLYSLQTQTCNAMSGIALYVLDSEGKTTPACNA